MLGALEGTEPDLNHTREPYERFDHFNAAIDGAVGLGAEVDMDERLLVFKVLDARDSEPGAPGSFAAGIEQHDDEGEEHHDGARVDDDLGDGEELRAEKQVENGERSHDDDERERAVNGMGLQQEIDGSSEAESGKQEEQDQMHCRSRKIPPLL